MKSFLSSVWANNKRLISKRLLLVNLSKLKFTSIESMRGRELCLRLEKK